MLRTHGRSTAGKDVRPASARRASGVVTARASRQCSRTLYFHRTDSVRRRLLLSALAARSAARTPGLARARAPREGGA
eukprot:101624-Pleurochrysis_carterae.AAC.3